MTADGKQLIGLGTDVGGMAMCYRTRPVRKAGLPTDRDAVAKLWPTWDDYIDDRQAVQGQEHRARSSSTRPPTPTTRS